MNFFNCRVEREGTEFVLEEGRAESTFENASAGGSVDVQKPSGIKGFRIVLPASCANRIARFENKAINMGVRPEDFRVTDKGQADAMIEARLELIESFGHETWLHLASGGHRFIARVQVSDGIPESGAVRASFDLGKVHFFNPETGEALV